MKTKFISGFLYLFLALFSQAQTTEWLISGGGTRSDKATTVVVDDNGYSYVTGYYNEQADFGSINIPFSNPSSKEVFVAKIDPAGNYVWVKTGENYFDDRGLGMCLDPSGNIYITGTCWGGITFGGITAYSPSSYTDQIYVIKLDTDGNTIWIKNAGNDAPGYPYNDDHGQDLISDSDGNIYLTGFISNNSDTPFPAVFDAISVPLVAHDSLAFVAKLANDGTWLWVRTFDGIYGYRDNAIAVDDQNNVYVSGGFVGMKTFGSSTITSVGEQDIFVVKYDPQGNFVFVQQAGGALNDRADGIVYGNDNSLYLTGEFRDHCAFGLDTVNNNGGPNGKDIFVAKMTKTGVWKWAKKAGSNGGDDRGTGICINNQGNVFVSGQISGLAKFGGDIELDTQGDSIQAFVAAIDTLGKWRWAIQGGGLLIDRAADVACDADCNVYFTGYYDNAMTFESFSVTAVGGKEIFSGKIADACFGYAPPIVPGDPTDEELCELIEPNAFTPNGDQINDLLVFSTNCNMEGTVLIFNRWGEIVYESSDLMEGWDGTTPNGQRVQEGTYFYHIEVRSKLGSKEVKSGFVTVFF
jgi:gliding motility-associated-like protein